MLYLSPRSVAVPIPNGKSLVIYFTLERVGPLSRVGNEEFNQHLASSTGAGSVFDQNLCNSSVMITKLTSPPIKAAKINFIHHQLLRQGANVKTVSSKGRIDQDRYPRHALQRSTGPKKRNPTSVPKAMKKPISRIIAFLCPT
jgi:hypothetical protein